LYTLYYSGNVRLGHAKVTGTQKPLKKKPHTEALRH